VPEVLSAIRQKLSRLQGETIVETPTSGGYTTTGFRCAPLAVYSDDYFNDRFGRFYAGTHANTNFVVTDFAKSNGVITFSPAVTGATDASDKFELYPDDYTPQELIDSINLAISSIEDSALLDYIDETLLTKENTFEYELPTDFAYLEKVLQEKSTANRYSVSGNLIDVRHWRILPGSPPKIWFDDEYVSLTSSRNLRLVGQKKQAQLVKDSDQCHLAQDYIIDQAKANLHFSRSDELDDAHYNKMIVAQSRSDQIKGRIQVAGRGLKV
jgi:hypothetical protein